MTIRIQPMTLPETRQIESDQSAAASKLEIRLEPIWAGLQACRTAATNSRIAGVVKRRRVTAKLMWRSIGVGSGVARMPGGKG
jgi:hypothetical protein